MSPPALRVLWIAAPLLALGFSPWPTSGSPSMAAAARAFVGTLDAGQKERAVFSFDAGDRTKWHFVPGPRKGLPLKEMTPAQKSAAHTLLRSGLSSQGYLKATSVMALDQVLRQIEGSDARDEELYFLAVYGDPGGAGPWGWRVEGHHLSLHFTSVTGSLVATTPAFLGANPAEVRDGPRAGLRVLALEEDLGRALLRSLDSDQRKIAVIADTAPADIILAPARKEGLGPPLGLPASKMTPVSMDLLRALLDAYAGNLRPDLAASQRERMLSGGLEGIHFAWAGGTDPGQGHYYRLHGPEFVIEYDNTQNGANHVHTVWHDLKNNFGGDLLRKHYEDSHRGK